MKQFKAIDSLKDLKFVEEEIKILKTLDNQYLIKYLDSFLGSVMNFEIFYIITDLFEVITD